MCRFVIQHHILTDSQHWDLMLEQADALVTWQIPLPPEKWADQKIPCRKLPNHRIAYLTYEGPVSHHRGEVHIICRGKYKLTTATASHWQFDLIGDTLRLKINLEQSTEEPDRCAWMLTTQSFPT